MRKIDGIVVHYTVTPADMDIGVAEVREWHFERGWGDIGYHFLVRLDGEIEVGRPLEWAGAHAKGHNHNTIGIAYVGGDAGADTRTLAQKHALSKMIHTLRAIFGPLHVWGHRELPGAATGCPGFDATKEYN